MFGQSIEAFYKFFPGGTGFFLTTGLGKNNSTPSHPGLGPGCILAGLLYAMERGVEVFRFNLQIQGAKDERRNPAQFLNPGGQHRGGFLFLTRSGERVGRFLHKIRLRRGCSFQRFAVVGEARLLEAQFSFGACS